MLEVQANIAESSLITTFTGHVGHGNFHLGIRYGAGKATKRDAADALARAAGLRAIRMGGTCSGEPGIGMHKLDLAAAEHRDELPLM